ncbi:hypothetical protein Tco_0069220 [Tanacetum coccineum]
MRMMMAVVSCEGDDDGVDNRDDGVEMGRGGEVAVVERAAVKARRKSFSAAANGGGGWRLAAAGGRSGGRWPDNE